MHIGVSHFALNNLRGQVVSYPFIYNCRIILKGFIITI